MQGQVASPELLPLHSRDALCSACCHKNDHGTSSEASAQAAGAVTLGQATDGEGLVELHSVDVSL